MLVGFCLLFLLEVSLSRVDAVDVVMERQGSGCDDESECKDLNGKCYSPDSVPAGCAAVPTCGGGGPNNTCVCCLQPMDRQLLPPNCASNGGICQEECLSGELQIPKVCSSSDLVFDPDNLPKCCVKLCLLFQGHCIGKDKQCVDPDFHILPCGCPEGEGCCVHNDKLEEANNYIAQHEIDCD